MANRPTGVTVICILGFIGAILGIVGGIGIVAIGGIIGAAGFTALGGLGMAAGIILLIVSIITLIALIWLWQMKKKGWTLTVIMEIISLILSVIQTPINFIGLILALIILIYLIMRRNLFK